MEIWQDLLQSAAAPDIDLKTLRHVLSIHGKRGLVDKVQECYDMVMMQGSGSSISGDEQSSSSSLSPSSSSSSVPITVISPKIILGKMKKSTASRNNKKSGSSSFNSIMPPETYLTNYYFDALTSCYTANPSTAINDICTTKFKNIINSTTTISSSTSSSPFIPSSDSVVAILRYAARSGNPKLAALVWKSWILQPIPSSTSSTPVTIPRSARMYHELITLYSNLNDPATAAVIVEEAYTLLEPIYNHSSSTTTTTCSVRNSKTGLRLHLALMHAYAVNGKIHETESMFRELCQKVVGGDDDDGGGSRIHGGWGDRIPKSAYLSLLDVYIKTGDLVKVGEVRAALKRLAEVPVDKEDEVEVDEKEE